MRYFFRHSVLSAGLAVVLAGPVAAQQMIESYRATIGAEDRRNSRGVALTQTAQILAQDRANVHRFGISHDGDESDRVFATTEARSRFAELVARGSLGPGVAEAVARRDALHLSVDVYGSGASPEYVIVSLAERMVAGLMDDSAQSPDALTTPPMNSPGAGQLAATSIPDVINQPGAPGAPVWSFRQADVQGGQIGSMDLQQDGALLIAGRCMMTPGAGGIAGVDPRAGVLTFSFAPSITGPRSDLERSIDFAPGNRTVTNWPLTFDETINAYTLRVTLTADLRESFERGTQFHLNSPQTGRLRARIPQNVGRAILAACGGRGTDASVVPGFSCDRGRHVTEITICSVPELAAMDQRMNTAYEAAPDNLKASQPVWLEARNACRTDVVCLEDTIAARTAMLGSQPPAGGNAEVVAEAGAGSPDGGSGTGLPGFDTVAPGETQVQERAVHADDPDRLIGNEALLDAFLLWTIANQPGLAAERSIQQRLRNFDYPPGLPEVSPRELNADVWQTRLEAAAAPYLDMPPARAVIEQPMTVRRDLQDPEGPVEIRGAMTTRIGDTEAITQIVLRDTGFGSTSIGLILTLEKPFFLPTPKDFTPIPDAMIGVQKGKILARIDATLARHSADAQPRYYRGGTARAQVHSVTLVYRPVIRENGALRDGADQILHVWTDDAPGDVETARPSEAREIAAFFGGGVSGDRLVVNALNLPESFGETFDAELRLSSPRDGLILNMNLAALLNASPERRLSPELAEEVMRKLMTERERVDLLPLNIAMPLPSDAPTELELRNALQQNEATFRQIVQDRSPELPLALRYIGTGSLGEYDFDNGGFPANMPSGSSFWLPSGRDGRSILTHLPDFIEMDPQDAQSLIEALARSNPRGNRLFAVVVDYDLTDLPARAGRSGPISVQEAASVEPVFATMAIGLYAADDPSRPFHTIPVPEGFATSAPVRTLADGAVQGSGSAEAASQNSGGYSGDTGSGTALPEDVFLTTGKSLMGAIALLDESGELIEEAILHARVVSPNPSSTFADRKAAFREDLRQSARDSYWIGTSFETTAYDPDLGGFPLSGVNFQAVGHGEDFDGIPVPPIAAAPEDYAVLRVTAEAAAAISDAVGRKRVAQAYFRVQPTGTYYDRNEGVMLTISAPLEAIFEKTDAFTLPRRADVRVALGAPDRLGVGLESPTTALEVPEALMLDHEGIDLLALSQAPDIYDDSMFRRMLVDRLLKERSAAAEDAGTLDIAWRRFFENPDQPLRADTVDAILPTFRDWTLARAAELPDVVLLPISGSPHPMTGCRGLSLTNSAQIEMNEPFLQANLPALLDPEITLSDGSRNLYGRGRPSPGPDGVLYWDGGGRSGGAQSCGYVSSKLRSLDRGLRPQDASFVSAVVAVRDQPAVSPVSGNPGSYVYRLAVDDLRFVPAAALDGPPERLAGVVMLTSDVLAATAYQPARSGGELTAVGQIVAGDWDPVVAVAPESQDILGLTLGSPLADVETALRDRLPAAATFVTAVPGQSIFGHTTAWIDPETGESFAAIFAADAEDQPVIALKRRVEFDAAQYSIEVLRQAFADKYGAVYRDDGADHLFWGALPPEEDPHGYCGAPGVLQTPQQDAVPKLEPASSNSPTLVSLTAATLFLREFGWPDAFDHDRSGKIPDTSQCAPLVAVRMVQNDERLSVVTWLFDRALAEEHATAQQDAAPMVMPEL